MKQNIEKNLLSDLPSCKTDKNIVSKIEKMVTAQRKKIIVLDDDPTGTQTVHNVTVLTAWNRKILEKTFIEKGNVFYILTNTRSMKQNKAASLIHEIMENIIYVSKKLSKDFVIVDRGDSTLRGHYPLEVNIIKECIEKFSGKKINGDIIIPFFKEGGRITYKDIHWVREGNGYLPAAKTEFSKDQVFGYNNSNLRYWIEEKTGGKYSAKDVISITLDEIRNEKIQTILQKLNKKNRYIKIIVNAVDYCDLEKFIPLLIQSEKSGMNFIYRTAASFVRTRSGISHYPLLKKDKVIPSKTKNSGLIIVGSHVKKSTIQLENALKSSITSGIEVDVEKLMNKDKRCDEIKKAVKSARESLTRGKETIVFTSRKLIESSTAEKEENLDISDLVSRSLVEIVQKIKDIPGYIITKGGITSSDIATKALGVTKATVSGQIKPGIPVWQTNKNLSYIVFPGNVGSETTLREIIEQLGSVK